MSSNDPQTDEKVPQPVLIFSAVLTALNLFVASTAFIDSVPRVVSGVGAALLAAITLGWGYYVRGQVTPFALVAARRLAGRKTIVAGPAAPGVTPQGVVVDVLQPPAGGFTG